MNTLKSIFLGYRFLESKSSHVEPYTAFILIFCNHNYWIVWRPEIKDQVAESSINLKELVTEVFNYDF